MIKYFTGQVNGIRYIHKIYEQITKECAGKKFQILDNFIIPKEFEIDDMNIGTVTKYEYWFMVQVFENDSIEDPDGKDPNIESKPVSLETLKERAQNP